MDEYADKRGRIVMKNLDKLICCFKELGFTPDINNFEHRIIIQKVCYLLQLKGISIGFNYGFYIRGPYSPDLAKSIYENKREVEQLKTNSSLSKDEKNKVGELKNIINLNPNILETAATYAYFIKQGLDPVSALKSVKTSKSFISESQIAVGISRAKEYLFPPTAKDIEEMKKEWRVWESTSNSDSW